VKRLIPPFLSFFLFSICLGSDEKWRETPLRVGEKLGAGFFFFLSLLSFPFSPPLSFRGSSQEGRPFLKQEGRCKVVACPPPPFFFFPFFFFLSLPRVVFFRKLCVEAALGWPCQCTAPLHDGPALGPPLEEKLPKRQGKRVTPFPLFFPPPPPPPSFFHVIKGKDIGE